MEIRTFCENICHSGKQYLAFPDTQKDRKGSDASVRRRAGVGSWEMVEEFPLSLRNCVVKDQKRRITINSRVSENISYYLLKYLTRWAISDVAIKASGERRNNRRDVALL